MGSLFGGSPSPPPAPVYTPAPTVDNSKAELEAAAAKQRTLSRNARGRASTLGAGGATGDMTTAPTAKTTLGA